MKLQNHTISPNSPPFIIAEISANHNQSLERALKIVEAAAHAGAHAIKLQTYTPDTMTLDINKGEFVITDEKSLWRGRSLYDLYKEAHTPWEWHKPIFERARELNILAFSTAFDKTSVDFLEKLKVPCYKIGSFENIDIPLIRKVASTGKPMIISTGMATIAELEETVKTAQENGCQEIVLLKCTSNYPASPENTNLRTIPHMRDLFHCDIGLSDHTPGIGVAIASVGFGATVIEKHFTLRRDDGGVDAPFSIEPEELKNLVAETERAWQALGQIKYGPSLDEEKARLKRRSLYVAKDLKAGQILASSNLKSIRPGYGLAPRYYDMLIGKKINREVSKGTPISWELFE